MIEIVVIEELLNRLSTQTQLVLFELIIIGVSPFFVYILLVKIVSCFRWDEGRLQSLLL
jgi:hypothetical protein